MLWRFTKTWPPRQAPPWPAFDFNAPQVDLPPLAVKPPKGGNGGEEPTPLPPVTGSLADFRGVVNERLEKRGSRKGKREVAEMIADWSAQNGLLLYDKELEQTYFRTPENVVHSILGNGAGLRRCLMESGINATETVYDWLLQELDVRASYNGEGVTIRHLSFLDNGTLYLSNGPSEMTVMDLETGSMEKQPNGYQGVLFAANTALPEWDPTADPVSTSDLISLNPNLEAPLEIPSYTQDLQTNLMRVWLVATLAGVRPLPILVSIGDKGSGKSTLHRCILQLLCGPLADVNSISKDERDFWVNVSQRAAVCYDNLDTKPPQWFCDHLAAASTGSSRQVRSLYKNAELTNLQAIAALSITTRTASFARGDLSERSLPLYVGDMTDEQRVSERRLKEGLLENRSGVLVHLTQLLRAAWLHLESVPSGLPARFLDFAEWVWACYRCKGAERHVHVTLDSWRKVQSLAVGENDPLIAAIVEFAPGILDEDPGKLSMKLQRDLLRALTDAGASLPDLGGGRALGAHLRDIVSALDLAGYRLERTEGGDGVNVRWTLRRKK